MALKSVSSSPAAPTAATGSSARGSSGGIAALLGGTPGSGTGTAPGTGTPGTGAPGSSSAAAAPNTPAASNGRTRSNARGRSSSSGGGAAGAGGSNSPGGAGGAAAHANTATSNGSTAAQAAGGPPNFLQALAQSSASAKGDPKAAGAVPASASDAKSTADDAKSDDGKDAASTDPNAIAAAIALLSQYLASPPASAANAAAQSPTPADAAQANAAASLNGITATNGTTSASDAKTGATEQDLAALLVGDADDDPTKSSSTDSTQSGGTSSGDSSSTSDDGGASAGAAAALLNPQAGIASHFSTQPVPMHRLDVQSPVGTAAWADELGGKVTWMANQGIESASLKLSPEHLGPLEVHISVQNGAASVMFGATQPDTRAALEQALPRLREMFAGQGLTLADAGVSREPPRQQHKPSAVAPVSGISAVSEDSAPLSTVMAVRLGLLDTYA